MRPTARPLALLALLPGLLLAACAGSPSFSGGTPEGRFAAAMTELDSATDALLTRLGQQETRDSMELAAIDYATGRRPGRAAPPPTAATEHAMAPALDALALHGRRLAALEAPQSEGPPPPEPGLLPGRAERGLAEFRAATGRPLPDALRRRGLAAIRALSASPETGTTADAHVAARQASVADAAAYLRGLLGEAPGQGLRGALEAGAESHLRAEAALLAAARTDRSLSVMERYALFHRISGAQSALPGQLQAVAALVDAFRLLPEAHAALARPDPDAVPEFGAFLASAAGIRAMAAAAPPAAMAAPPR